MGIGLVAGRELVDERTTGEVVVNGPFARQQWSDGRALGETIRLGDRGDTFTVVGITARHHTRGLDRESPTVYFPLSPADFGGQLTVVTRTAGSPALLVRPLLDAGRAVDADVPLTVKTMEERMAVQLWPFRTVSWLFGICGTLALLLATIGLAGVVIHAVNRRTREFGVRLSVGATPRDLMREVLRGSAMLLVPGLVIGIAMAAALARLVQYAFFGVNVMNPLTYLLVGLLECAIVLAACVGPARRASRVDPLIALRSE
jgi:hypothetical protein